MVEVLEMECNKDSDALCELFFNLLLLCMSPIYSESTLKVTKHDVV